MVTLVDPDNAAQLAACMERALDRGRVQALTAAQIEERLSRWTWGDAADAYLTELSKASSRPQGPLRAKARPIERSE